MPEMLELWDPVEKREKWEWPAQMAKMDQLVRWVWLELWEWLDSPVTLAHQVYVVFPEWKVQMDASEVRELVDLLDPQDPQESWELLVQRVKMEAKDPKELEESGVTVEWQALLV